MTNGIFLLSPQIDRHRSAATVLADTIAMAKEAEGLGFDHLWVAEHHFANLSLSPSPLITLSHLAAHTRRIRLGTGVLVLPLQDPMRLAEEIAYVDIVSGGRLDVGSGRAPRFMRAGGLGPIFPAPTTASWKLWIFSTWPSKAGVWRLTASTFRCRIRRCPFGPCSDRIRLSMSRE